MSVDQAAPMSGHPVWRTPLLGWQLIEASAGTGKTWTMAGLFARAVIELDVPLEGILALTYTRAATDELKRRITAQLQTAYWVLTDAQVADEGSFAASLHASLQEEVARKQAVIRLELALANLDKLAVFTLHSFGQRIARLHGTALGLAPAQEVTTDSKTWLRPAMERFWLQFCEGGEWLSQALVKLDLNPVSLLRSMQAALDFPMTPSHAPLLNAQDTVNQVHSIWLEMREISEIEWADLGEWISRQDWDTRHPSSRKALNLRGPTLAAFVHGTSCMASTKQLDAVAMFSQEAVQSKLKDGAIAPAEERMRLCSLFVAASNALKFLPAAIAYEFRVWCGEHLQGLKRELGVQTHDDVLITLSAALHKPQSGIALARDLAKRFPVAFLDESQDTDRVPLSIIEAVYGRAGQPDAPYCFIAVGDPKQSIYRFRGADVHEFLGVRAKVALPQTLDVNRRSSPLLVQACNQLFARPGVFGLKGLEFVPVSAVALQEGETERLQPLHWIWLDGASKKDVRPRVLNSLGLLVERELRAGTGAHEIAILVQTNRQGMWVQSCLAERGWSSVIMSQESVFASEESQELLTILCCLADPADSARLRAAGATRLLGWQVGELLNPASLEQLRDQVWQASQQVLSGAGVAGLRAWLAAMGCYQRLAQLVNAERRLSNLQQLLDLMRNARPSLRTPIAAAQWLQEAQWEGRAQEGDQLLLESDQKLIRIVTQHASKGLEYPVVFLPFAWDSSRFSSGNWSGPFLDHEPTTVLDFQAPLPADVERRREREEDAEKIRLFYVAVTRAERALYLFATDPVSNHHSALSGMQLALGMQAQEGTTLPLLEALCEKHSATMQLEFSDLIAVSNETVSSSGNRQASSLNWTLDAAPKTLPVPWRFSSYTSLVRASEALSVADVDAHASLLSNVPDDELALPSSIRERFISGAQAGIALHAILENRNFFEPFETTQMAGALARNACPSESAAEVALWLNEVVAAPLGEFALKDVRLRDCRSEMEFMLAARHRASAPGRGLVRALAGLGLAELTRDESASLGQASLDGLLQGFIDLVFTANGRYYVLDWKSNHLGNGLDSYSQAAMRAAMVEHRYDWQAAIYLLALHRHLRASLADYRPEEHLGGAWYVFLRGAGDARRPRGSGIFHYSPDWEALARLDEELH